MLLLESVPNLVIPTSAVGLLGLIAGYLYYYYKNRNDNKVKRIEALPAEDRLDAVESELDIMGEKIDTKGLTPDQKFELLKRKLKARIQVYWIIAIAAIVIAIIVAFIIWSTNGKTVPEPIPAPTQDTVPTYSFTSLSSDLNFRIKERLLQDRILINDIKPKFKIELITKALKEPLAADCNADRCFYYFNKTPIAIVIHDNEKSRSDTIEIGMDFPGTKPVKTSISEAKDEYHTNLIKFVNDEFDSVYAAIKKQLP